ncbi:MAG TPA: asparagine synthase-related protein, partial [Thermoanaerobaculia bacterium]|nr:asparagine synthase-related protein [Thermoanaerobaculia bacterium]
MAHASFHTAPGPPAEQPCRHGAVLVTWDGRLDNRADLAASLGAERANDVELLALAYERWGPTFPSRIVGDFALALWDGRARLLLLARDPVGTRPLFYAVRPDGGLLWASTLAALRAGGADLGEVDEEWIAGYFSWSIDPATTPWRGVRAVPPGHVLAVGGGPPRLQCFWKAEEVPAVRLGGDAEYEERYRELFLASVQNRLRAAGPVAAELSGGVDSSSIVCAAAHLLRAGSAETPGLLTASHLYERSRTADETPFIEEVEAFIGRTGRHILESEAPILTGLVTDIPEIPTSNHCFRRRYQAIYDFMAENGSRVLLSGLGGDHLLTSQVATPYVLADLLRGGRLGALRTGLAAWRRELGKPYLQLLWEGAVCPLLPRPARMRLARPPIPFPSWLDRGFVRRRDLAARFVALTDAEGYPGPPGKREQAGAVRGALRAAAWLYDWWGRPVEVTFPFLDRPLMEFCLGAPAGQFVRPGETRSLHRRALA